jgi:hypothetical protein
MALTPGGELLTISRTIILISALALVALLAVPLLASGAGAPDVPVVHGAQVVAAERFDASPPLRDMVLRVPVRPRAPRMELYRLPGGASDHYTPDAAVQSTFGPAPLIPAPLNVFEGLAITDSTAAWIPPDTTGEMGLNHYMQLDNDVLAVYNRSGTRVYGPQPVNILWAGFGGACEAQNDGDPIVLYDQLANRFLASQFALPNYPSGPFYECVAVSQTSDPTGAWYRYAFQTSATLMDDYPKLGVWPDGYYLTANLFNGNAWAGTGAYVLDRTRMLSGLSATMQYFELPPSDWGSLLPADVDGSTLPPAGSPNYMVEVVDGAWDPANWPNDELQLHRFHVDWNNPGNTTFNMAPVEIPVAAFDGVLCNFSANCVPQASSARKLDALADRLMQRLAYRNFGTYETLVVNHTVDVATNQAEIRWYEIRSPNSTPVLYQQGTYAPDSTHRWMGSIAMDRDGNMLLGFSASSSSLDPSIRYTGRLVTDPLGTMPQGEGTIITGTGAQTDNASRWGDYSHMSIDPLDDCTFWYTTEYVQTTGTRPWRTKWASVKYPSCGAAQTPTPTATGTLPTATSTPVPPTATSTPLPPTPTDTPLPPQYRLYLPAVFYNVAMP